LRGLTPRAEREKKSESLGLP